ncbi:MAG TPA: hypothetical protein VMY42_28345 [Thermoguttaceae bacterium]|nr:hypothetical protein [Thermoguttaceae bacterium]
MIEKILCVCCLPAFCLATVIGCTPPCGGSAGTDKTCDGKAPCCEKSGTEEDKTAGETTPVGQPPVEKTPAVESPGTTTPAGTPIDDNPPLNLLPLPADLPPSTTTPR